MSEARSFGLLVRLRQIVWIALAVGALLIDSDFAIVIGALIAIAAVAFETRAPLRDLGLARPRSIGLTIALGLAIGFVMLFVSKLLLTPVIEKLTGVPRDLSAFEFVRSDAAAYLTLLPRIWIGAAICEEVIFRGLLIGRIETGFGGRSRIRTSAAVLLSSIVFGAAHTYQGPSGMLVTGTIGLIFAIVYVNAGRNLWITIVAHGVYDTLSLGLVYTSLDRTFTDLAHRLFAY